MESFQIRPATAKDVGTIRRFIVELAVYEREPDAVLATEDDLASALFCENPRVFALICERPADREAPAVPLGFAVYFYNFSTWLGKHGIYLEDLYVTPEARGEGAGKALLKAVARIAWDEDCGRYEWNVLKWNTPSIEFYEAKGAERMEEWVGYRMDRNAIEAFLNDD
ncbi:MAG: GNAT family N-acetyltransferase [Pseudomonadota bacterium]